MVSKKLINQGGLDSLCGVYSLINADIQINNSTKDESKQLFDSILKFLDSHNKLLSTLVDGMLSSELKNVLHEVLGEKIPSKKMPFVNVKTPPLSIFLKEIKLFLEKNTNRTVLISLSGKYDHWTIVTKITNARIYLLDSDGLQYLNIKNCITGKMNSDKNSNVEKTHVLYPAQTYFLSR